MEVDSLLMFDDGDTFTATRDSTKKLDFLAPGDEIAGTFALVAQYQDVGNTSGVTVTVDIQTSPDGSSDWKKLATYEAVTIPGKPSGTSSGYLVKFGAIPYGMDRFLKVHYTVSGTISGGKVTAFLTRSRIVD